MATFIVTTTATSRRPAPSTSVEWEFAGIDDAGCEIWIVTTDAPDELLDTISDHPQVISIYDASDNGQ